MYALSLPAFALRSPLQRWALLLDPLGCGAVAIDQLRWLARRHLSRGELRWRIVALDVIEVTLVQEWEVKYWRTLERGPAT